MGSTTPKVLRGLQYDWQMNRLRTMPALYSRSSAQITVYEWCRKRLPWRARWWPKASSWGASWPAQQKLSMQSGAPLAHPAMQRSTPATSQAPLNTFS